MMTLLHTSQLNELKSGGFDPENYFRTIAEFQEDEFENHRIDHLLAQELFFGDCELSMTFDQPSEASKRDFEGRYFHSGLNILDNNFIRNLDEFQIRYPPKSLRGLRSNTLNLVGFDNTER